MISIGRVFGIPIACAAILLSFATVSADWLRELLDGTNVGGQRISWIAELRRSVRLAQESDAVRERIRTKDEVVVQLVAGDLTLFQAAACFLAVHDTPELRARLRKTFPASSESESACRQVISWVVTFVRVQQSPEQSEIVRQRLETELREHLERYDTLELPE